MVSADRVDIKDSRWIKETVVKMEKEIDRRLLNGEFEIRNKVNFVMSISGELDPQLHYLLTDKYFEGGWNMALKGSSSNGERGGLTEVTLSKIKI